MAIGSSRWRILRQVLVEASVISILGGACACGLAWMALTGLAELASAHRIPDQVLRHAAAIVDPDRVADLGARRHGVRRDAAAADIQDRSERRHEGRRGQPFAGRRWALRDCLLAAQIALCCVTVTAAFVSLRGLGKALTMDLGFQPRNAVRDEVRSESGRLFQRSAARFQRQLLERVSHLPGVKRRRLFQCHAPLPGAPRSRCLLAANCRLQALQQSIQYLCL